MSERGTAGRPGSLPVHGGREVRARASPGACPGMQPWSYGIFTNTARFWSGTTPGSALTTWNVTS
jgi:hypothetical protein